MLCQPTVLCHPITVKEPIVASPAIAYALIAKDEANPAEFVILAAVIYARIAGTAIPAEQAHVRCAGITVMSAAA